MTALTLVIPSRSTAVRALKAYPGISHGMLTANAGALNADLLKFVTN